MVTRPNLTHHSKSTKSNHQKRQGHRIIQRILLEEKYPSKKPSNAPRQTPKTRIQTSQCKGAKASMSTPFFFVLSPGKQESNPIPRQVQKEKEISLMTASPPNQKNPQFRYAAVKVSFFME